MIIVEMMKITIVCIPSINESGLLSDVSMHFGKTHYFTFIELEDGEIKRIEVKRSFGKHGGGSKTPAEIIVDSNIDVLICGNLGPKAASMLRDSEIEIFAGASGKVKDTLSEWKVGMLPVADKFSCSREAC